MTTALHPRERLIQTAAQLVHRQGWSATGINQILTDAGIPKGSFYYYFRSKEALGVAVLQMYVGGIKKLLETTVLNDSLTPEAAIEAFMHEISRGESSGLYRFGCPVSNLATETATQCQPLLTEALRGVELYRSSFAKLVARAQASRPMNVDEADATAVAETIVMMLQGAFLGFKCDPTTTRQIDAAHAAIQGLLFGSRARIELASKLAANQQASAQRAMAS